MQQFTATNWPISYAGGACSIFDDEDSGAPDQTSFEKMAVELLWNWTGRGLGTTSETIRPCRCPEPGFKAPSSFEGSGPWPFMPGFGSGRQFLGGTVGSWIPVMVAGAWYNLKCGVCQSDACRCEPNSVRVIELPGSAVSVDRVVIDGTMLMPNQYRLEQGRWLIRTDGEAWPDYQDLEKDVTEAGTWAVTYERGVEVPMGGQIAAGILACELAKAYVGDEDCGLPARLQSMTREGVTIGVADPFDGATTMTRDLNEIPQIKTGIWAIDSWVAGILLPRRSVGVISVDYRRGR